MAKYRIPIQKFATIGDKKTEFRNILIETELNIDELTHELTRIFNYLIDVKVRKTNTDKNVKQNKRTKK